jgi:hypothetical protein
MAQLPCREISGEHCAGLLSVGISSANAAWPTRQLRRFGLLPRATYFAHLNVNLAKGMTSFVRGIAIKRSRKLFDFLDEFGRSSSLAARRFPWSWHRKVSV